MLADIWAALNWLSWLIPIIFLSASITRSENRWGKQIMLGIYGIVQTLIYGILILFQQYLNVQREDPFDTRVIYYAFPSLFVFYISSFVTFLAVFCYIWNIGMDWSYWVALFTVFLFPQFFTWWVEFNYFYELCISSLVGIVTTTAFHIFFHVLIEPDLPYLINVAPFSWAPSLDTYVSSVADQLKTKLVASVLNRWKQDKSMPMYAL